MATAIITGASRGIGAALTRKLASLGVTVIAVARGEEDLKKLKAEFPEKIHIVAADIGTEEGRNKIVNTAAQYKVIDYLVNNAAVITPLASLESIKAEELTHILNINVVAPTSLTTQLIPHLANGRVLNVSSAAGFLPTPGIGPYNISKAALDMATDVLRLELKKRNVAVTRVIPGEVETDMQEKLRTTAHPIAKQFQESQEKGVLMPTSTCAGFLAWLLTETSTQEFIERKWTIYDEAHRDLWLKETMKLPLPLIAGQRAASAPEMPIVNELATDISSISGQRAASDPVMPTVNKLTTEIPFPMPQNVAQYDAFAFLGAPKQPSIIQQQNEPAEKEEKSKVASAVPQIPGFTQSNT